MSADESARAYLSECLALDPATEPGAILALRRRRRGREPEVQRAAPAEDRERVLDELAELREGFFELPVDELSRRLAAVAVDPHPDLARQHARLTRASVCRRSIDAARADSAVDARFLSTIEEALVAPQRESAEIKRRALAAMKNDARRSAAQRSIRAFKRTYPEIYALEPEWFEQVNNASRILKDRRRPATAGLGCIGAYALLRLVMYLIEQVRGE